jgi:mannose-1-phosphate guanylyltransferase/mannose-6-phosphate isomerase
MSKVYPVIMCGGSGTRLWPLSRRDHPKQFAVILEGKSLFEWAYDRAKSFGLTENTICVGHQDHRFLIQDVVGKASAKHAVLLEPTPRNTAAAIAIAALFVSRVSPEGILACMPADHVIGSTEQFHNSLLNAVKTAEGGWLTILGVAPTRPATSYGYIKLGEPLSKAVWRAESFVEKPHKALAKRYCRENYRWNSGLVVARADVLLAALEQHAPDILGACRKALDKASFEHGCVWLHSEAFLACPSISFDYAVLERDKRVAVAALDAPWNDVGSWTELAKLYPADSNSNRITGEVEIRSCEKTFVQSSGRLTLALGLRNMVIVDTPDALLVADASEIDKLKEVIGDFTQANRKEISSQRRVVRPWGWFESVDRGENYQVKKIVVNPGGVLSLQYHHHRAEHWVVVKGTALVTCGERQFGLQKNESTYIPQGAVHRLENPGSEPLELIEVQSGSYLGEDDIVRLSDSYGRAETAT